MADDAADKKLVRVVIFQQPYTVRSSGDVSETEALAHSVDQLMHQIANKAASTDPTRIAVLASLHLADRLRRTERELTSLRERASGIRERLEALADLSLEE